MVKEKKIDKEIILTSPRGFCAGVERAVEILNLAIEIYPPPIYVHHEIVHNKHVVNNFKNRGVIFTDNLELVPEKKTLIFSAHGVSPEIKKLAELKKINIIDATCPLVTKVHLEARKFAKAGYRIILIGHKKHVETIGTRGEAYKSIVIVENIEEAKNLSFSKNDKIAYLTQTTMSIYETQDIVKILKQKFPTISSPKKSDICYATTNRQDAVREMSKQADIIFIIGSKNSSNSNRLKELAKKMNKTVFLIDDKTEINENMIQKKHKIIGISSGASAPENLIQEMVSFLEENYNIINIKSLKVREENIIFNLPIKLKKDYKNYLKINNS